MRSPSSAAAATARLQSPVRGDARRLRVRARAFAPLPDTIRGWTSTISTERRSSSSCPSARRSPASFASRGAAMTPRPSWRCESRRSPRGPSTSSCGPRSNRSMSCSKPATRCARPTTRAASGGGDASALRDAARRERDAVDALIEAARGLLSSEGHELSPTTIDRVTETLQAAALDEDARARRAGGPPRARAASRRARARRRVCGGACAREAPEPQGQGQARPPTATATQESKAKAEEVQAQEAQT